MGLATGLPKDGQKDWAVPSVAPSVLAMVKVMAMASVMDAVKAKETDSEKAPAVVTVSVSGWGSESV